MKDFNYKYYEHQATEAFVTAEEYEDNAKAQLFLLDTIARSLACIADVLENAHNCSFAKEFDYDAGLVEEDDDDNG